MRDGFLNILASDPGTAQRLGQFAVMFMPLDRAGAVPAHYCRTQEELTAYLRQIGISERKTLDILADIEKSNSASLPNVRLSQEQLEHLGLVES